MITILTSEAEAVNLAKDIHNYLSKNRDEYNAKKWSGVNKSDNYDKWYVKVPNDYPNNLELVSELPKDWYNEEILD